MNYNCESIFVIKKFSISSEYDSPQQGFKLLCYEIILKKTGDLCSIQTKMVTEK